MNKTDKVYINLLNDIIEEGENKNDRTATGTKSVFGRMIRFDLEEGFPLLTTKKVYWKGIVTELIWFLRGETNIQWLVQNGNNIWVGDAYKYYYNSIQDDNGCLPDPYLSKKEFIEKIKIDNEFAKKWGELGPIYGKQWRNFGGIDQIENLIDTLRNNPDSRRMIVSAWNPKEIPEMKLPPCHYGFEVWTKELTLNERYKFYVNKTGMCASSDESDEEIIKRLEDENIPTRGIKLMWHQRSCDVPLGIPFNIASYALLVHIIGAMVNMVPLELIGSLGDCHIYNNQIDGAKEQISREGYELPMLEIANNVMIDGSIDDFIGSCLIDDFQILGYKHDEKIKFPLSN